MRFGVYLPTFAWRDLRLDQAARVKAFARKAEELGFDALWVAEHFLEAPGLYGTVWMSPLLCLAHAALARQALRRARGAEPDRRRRRLARPGRRQPADGQGRRPRDPRALRQDRTRPEFAAVRSPELPPSGRHQRPREGALAAAPDLRARDGHASDVRESPAIVFPRDDARDRRADPGSRGGGRPGHGPGHLRLRPRAARAVRDRHRPPVRALDPTSALVRP